MTAKQGRSGPPNAHRQDHWNTDQKIAQLHERLAEIEQYLRDLSTWAMSGNAAVDERLKRLEMMAAQDVDDEDLAVELAAIRNELDRRRAG